MDGIWMHIKPQNEHIKYLSLCLPFFYLSMCILHALSIYASITFSLRCLLINVPLLLCVFVSLFPYSVSITILCSLCLLLFMFSVCVYLCFWELKLAHKVLAKITGILGMLINKEVGI